MNLHDLKIQTDNSKGQPLENYSLRLANPYFDAVECVFRNEEERLIQIIRDFKDGAIFGCIAWLTSPAILQELGKCENVQIVVQKEDFLRPDINIAKQSQWKKTLSELYGRLSCRLDKFQFREPICNLSTLSFDMIEGVRCVGNHNSDKHPAFPRMHHKFLVFCKIDKSNYQINEHGYYESVYENLRPQQEKFNDFNSWYEAHNDFNQKYLKPIYAPVSLWTGSFNLTKNATQSFENAIYFIEQSGNNELINAYLNEHHQIYALSEPLNWDASWAVPEFRIGT